MRVIEEAMLKALKQKKNWKVYDTRGNTVIRYDADDKCSAVFLFGNHIADYWHEKANPLEVNIDTLLAHPTRTTKSRLRALGADIRVVKGVMYLDGYEV